MIRKAVRVVGVSAIAAVLALSGGALANPAAEDAAGAGGSKKLMAWPPTEPAEEPVQLIVSVPEQRVSVYVGGELVASSPVSTGKTGHATPRGVFSILDKKKFHRSNIYSRAPMPFMQRLTWSGIALHASDSVPDHPASHGCVRLPPEFAKELYGLTRLGAHVIVSGEDETRPVEISHPNLFEAAPPAKLAAEGADAGIMGDAAAIGDGATVVEAEAAADLSPVRILVTRRTGRELLRDVQTLLANLGFEPGEIDGWMGRNTGNAIIRFQESRGLPTTGAMSDELVAELYDAAGLGAPPSGHLYVRRDFEPVYDAPISFTDPQTPLGAHLFTALELEGEESESRWLAVTLDDGVSDEPIDDAEEVALEPEDEAGSGVTEARAPAAAVAVLDRLEIADSVRQRIAAMLTPGSSMAVTDQGISQETIARGTDFVVLTR